MGKAFAAFTPEVMHRYPYETVRPAPYWESIGDVIARHWSRRLLILSASTLGFFNCLSVVLALDFVAPVVSVLDGDTIEVLHNNHPERIRLSGIDCPEKGQAYGHQAKQATSAMAFGKYVILPVEPFQLFRYLDEQSFRFNTRKSNDQGRFMEAMASIAGKRVTYEQLLGRATWQ